MDDTTTCIRGIEEIQELLTYLNNINNNITFMLEIEKDLINKNK